MKTFVQIDCECLARTPNAVVLSFGACFYDVTGIKDSIELFPQVTPQVDAGRAIEDETLMWWLGRPEESRKNIINGDRQPLAVVADEFCDWFHDTHYALKVDRKDIWFSCLGNDFDLPLLVSLLGKYRGMPWDNYPFYRNKMCLRALNEVYRDDIVWPEGPVAHTARMDALNQAKAHISLLEKFPNLR